MATLTSPFRKTPAYRYIRESDKLPLEAPEENPVAKVKLFNPTGAGTWFLASYNPETGEAFGVAEIHEREYGYIYLPELVAFRGRFGLPIERDIHFTPRPLAELIKETA